MPNHLQTTTHTRTELVLVVSVTGGSLNTDIGPDSEAHITPNEADDMEPDRNNAEEKNPENRLAFVDEKNGKLEAKTNTAV